VIQSIQFMRAIAALFVLYFHAITMVSTHGGYKTAVSCSGAVGVDIFFIISGFVIFLLTNRKAQPPGKFLARRVIRISPPYWLYTSITVALLLFVPEAYRRLKFDPVFVLTSYFFLLGDNTAGHPGTVLGVGWTIAFELYFYVLFTVALLFTPRSPLRTIIPVIFFGTALSFLIKDIPSFAQVAISALPLEFLAGCLLAKAYLARYFLPQKLCLPLITVALGEIWYVGYVHMFTDPLAAGRVVFFGLPAMTLVYCIVSLEAISHLKFPKIVLFIGNSSYSLYLCHGFVLLAVVKLWLAADLQNLPSINLLATGIFAAICIGSASYFLFERPVTRWLMKRFEMLEKKIASK